MSSDISQQIAASRKDVHYTLPNFGNRGPLIEQSWISGASLVQAGDSVFRDKLSELKLVKAKVGSLRGELLVARREAAATENAKQEVLVLEKQLLREQNKTKALSEELETPLNVHRFWLNLQFFTSSKSPSIS